MKFNCKDLSITDDEFGCTIEFKQEKEDEFNIEKSVKEIMNSLQPYIMLQRTYGEDDFEEDFYYFKTIDFDKSGKLKDFTIEI